MFKLVPLHGARAGQERPERKISVFLKADAVLCAKAGQKPPDGHYNLKHMLRRVLS